MQKGAEQEARRVDYDGLLMTRGHLSLGDAKGVLTEIVKSGRLALPDLPMVPFSAVLQASMVQRHGSHGRRARRFPIEYSAYEFPFQVQPGVQVRPASGYICGLNVPLYPHTLAAIQDVLGFRVINEGTPELLALAPDYRARVKRVCISKSLVTVTVEVSDGDSTIIGKVCHEDIAGRKSHCDLDFRDGTAAFETKGYARNVIVALLGRERGDVIDEWFYDPSTGLDSGAFIDTGDEDWDTLILGGESESLEFKQQMPDAVGLAAEICAFANSGGGRILVGVNDEAEVIGCDTIKVKEKITQLTDYHCKPVPPFKVDSISLSDKPVIVITVPEGSDRPYLVNGKVYVRSGATKRPATRYELDQMYPSRAPVVYPWR
jgi:hypothetical protein